MKQCTSKYRCGPLTSSHCVSYQGPKLKSVPEDRFDCDVRLTDILVELDKEVKALQEATNLKGFPGGCLNVTEIDTIRTVLERIQTRLCQIIPGGSTTPLGDQVIGANLGCLTDGCTTQDTRTLKQILELLASRICALESRTTGISTPQNSLYLL